MTTPAEPRRILEALLQPGAQVPVPASAAELERARQLLASLPTAPAAEVEGLPEPLALAVLEGAARAREARLIEALTGSPRKAIAKAAKRAQYQLRSAGVALPEKRAEAPTAPKPAAEQAEHLPCLLSPITGTGEQAALLVRPLRGGGLENYQVVFTDEAGMISVDHGEASRGAYRKLLKEFRGQLGAPVEVGTQVIREVLGEAAAVNLATHQPFPKGASEAMRAFDIQPLEPPAPPSPEPDDERLATRGHTLHEQPEIAGWLPPEPEIRLLAQRLDEVTSSPLQLTPAQRREQILQKVLATATEFFTVEKRRLYARRLWRTADYFERTGRAEPAQIARAEARRLFHDASLGSRFADYLFEKVWVLTERARAAQPPAPADPPSPGGPQPPPEKKTPGGLILP